MIRLGVHFPNPHDACSYYRGAGVINFLKAHLPELVIFKLEESSWHHISQYDAVFVQRPFEDSHLEIIKQAKKMGIPSWIDHDDDFTTIPVDNPAYHVFTQERIQSNIKNCIQLATVCTTTTEPLRKLCLKYNDAVTVIPNAHNDYIHGPCAPEGKRSNVILWRGGNTHQNDLLTYKEVILEVAKDHPGFEWHFLGYFPFFVAEKMNVHHHRFSSIHDYFARLKEIRPAIVFCPLAHNPFNHAKSNIMWIEGTAAGAQVIAPSFGEWKMPGIINFSSPSDFYDAMSKGIKSLTGEVTEETKKSASYIREKASLSFTNQLRGLLLSAVVGDSGSLASVSSLASASAQTDPQAV